jgi:hypothetical protein
VLRVMTNGHSIHSIFTFRMVMISISWIHGRRVQSGKGYAMGWPMRLCPLNQRSMGLQFRSDDMGLRRPPTFWTEWTVHGICDVWENLTLLGFVRIERVSITWNDRFLDVVADNIDAFLSCHQLQYGTDEPCMSLIKQCKQENEQLWIRFNLIDRQTPTITLWQISKSLNCQKKDDERLKFWWCRFKSISWNPQWHAKIGESDQEASDSILWGIMSGQIWKWWKAFIFSCLHFRNPVHISRKCIVDTFHGQTKGVTEVNLMSWHGQVVHDSCASGWVPGPMGTTVHQILELTICCAAKESVRRG